jgi:hypothetical protein
MPGSTFPSGWLRPAIALLLLLPTGGCAVGVPTLQRPDQPRPAGVQAPLKAHLHSGELVVFDAWSEDVDARRFVGVGRRFDGQREATFGPGALEVPVDSIALLEIIQDRVDGGLGVGLTMMAAYTVLTAAVAVVCVSDPKACFGSCPTFYLDDDEGNERLVAEGFSSSVARALEATDLDDLGWTAAGGRFSIRMRNEALESHAVRHLRLHAVAEPMGQRVFATPDHRFHLARRTVEPIGCTAPEGDCLAQVRADDGKERHSLADATNLAAREIVELEFPAAGSRLGLVVGARHSFVSTFLFYQMLAYLGREAGVFLASVERGTGSLAERMQAVMSMLGTLEVSVQGEDGEWHRAGTFEESGPLATDVHLVELPPVTGSGPVRVRLNLTRGFWRLGHVALAEIGDAVESRVITPTAAERLDRPEVRTGAAAKHDPLRVLLHPDLHLVTGPGDHFRIDFDLPEATVPEGPAYRLFLESTGYYYEWMRSEWLEEESPGEAAMMLLQPEVMFRRLAPAFKELEPTMEESFWNSRFRR